MREEMRNHILQKAMLYFARNGFARTKISDLSKHIGIGQGTIYVYFESKEELFLEILKLADYYWSVIYLYALKRLFTTEFEMITAEDLGRTVLK